MRSFLFYAVISIAITLPATLKAEKNESRDLNPPKKQRILVGSEIDFPPYAIVNDEGKADGFSVDLIKAVAEVLGLEIEIRVGPWAEVRSALEKGEIDALPLVAYSKERDETFDFTIPHTTAFDAIFVRRGDPEIKTFEGLRDKEIIVMRSDAAHDFVVKSGISEHIVLTKTIPDALRLLASGKHDAVLLPKLLGLLAVKDLNLTNLETTGPVIDAYKRTFSFAVREGDADLLARLNQGISIVKTTGKYDEIYDKWFGVIEPRGIAPMVVFKYIISIVFVALLIIIGIVIWNIMLKKLVAKNTRELLIENEQRKRVEVELQKTHGELEQRVRQRTAEFMESEAKYRDLVETSQDLIWRIDREGRFTYLNPAWESTLGYRLEEMIGHEISDFKLPEEREQNFQRHQQAMKGDSSLDPETTYISKTGEEVILNVKGKPLLDASGQVVGAQGTATDITESKRAEKELRQSEEKYRLLVQRSLEGIYIHVDGKIAFCNQAFAVMFGYDTPEELFGLDIFKTLIAPCDYDRVLSNYESLIQEQPAPERYEFQGVHKTGDIIHVEILITLVNWEGEVGALGTVIDITERKRAEEGLTRHKDQLEEIVQERTKELHEAQEQLMRREKLAVLGQLAGSVGHELRNPLGAIKTSVYFLNMALEEPEPDVKTTLENLNKEVATSERIIGSLLDFARPKPPTRRKVDVNGLLQETLGSASVPGNIETVTQLDEALPPILSDPDQLSQIFGNIILNAIQAMSKGGRLLVKSETPAQDWVAVSFSDTGEGVPQENLEKLFEPLFTTKAKGIGLGMALTKNLVEGHGGTIEVSSEVGKGSTFKVRLPENGRG